ncbi:MAG: sigma-70 family RNA polymerase sigma factor [Clostridia bacterium]|nr:sigma-70 family RNA polymerase sigma factor [Clostridia bacterium]
MHRELMQSAENKHSYEGNRELLELARSDNEKESMAATEALIELNRGLLRSIALRFRDRGVEMEDLMQIGTIGMIKAIRSFDSERGTAFSTYAVPLIFGEIRRHMRDEGPIKVGRYYKKLGASIMSARSRILLDDGREAHIEELATICGVSAEEAAMALEATSPVMSLSDKAFGADEDGLELEHTIADEESEAEFERLRDRIALGQAISQMSELWQRIVLLRYYRDMTQQQTADALGLSQVKISREEKKIVEFLRSKMS